MRSGREAMARAPTRSGTTRPAPGRKTTVFASTTCCCRRRRPTGWSPPASTSMCAVGKSRPITFRSGRISRLMLAALKCSALEERVQDAPGQLVVHADANDVVVEAHALIARKRQARRRVEIGFVLQSDVQIFNLRRPVAVELDLDAAARGPAPMPVLFRNLTAGRRHDAVLDIGERAAGGGVEQPIVLRVTETAAEGRKPALLHLIAEGGVGGEQEHGPLLARGRGV